MAVRVQLRHDTAANWTAVNPILAVGEVGLETDTTKHKVGDGVTAWSSLAYALSGIFAPSTGIPESAVTNLVADLAALIPLSQKAAANGVATLGADSKIPSAQLPALAITDTFVVASQAAMLALTAQRGDVAIRTDSTPNIAYILTADDPTTLANWQPLDPATTVTSVNGATGAVTITAAGLGALSAANNLSDLANAATARTNLGLGTAATHPATDFATDAAVVHNSLVDAKGDLFVGTANDVVARLAVGSDGQVLTADSAQTGGIGWATPANAGSASAMGYMVATDTTLGAGNFLVNDGGVTNDGVIAAGSLSTLTSAAALFPTTIPTQKVTLFQGFDVPDAAMSSGTAILTSAGNNFPAGIVAGMTVDVAGAGAAGVTFTTTVVSRDSAGQLTLAANATTTITARPIKIFGFHQSVVTSRGSAGSLTLTTPAPYAFSAANVSWGTDNWTAAAALGALAKTQGKPIWVPPGNYNFLPASGRGLFGAMTAMNVVVHGARGLSRFIASLGSRPTVTSSIVQAGSGCFTDVKNFVSAYVGPPPAGDGSTGPVAVLITRAGTTDLIWKAEGIDSDATYSPWGGIWQQAGTGTAKTRGMTRDCRLIQQFEAIQLFVNPGTDATFVDYGSKFETTWLPTTMPTDNAFHAHALYKHPSVAIATSATTFRVTMSMGGAYCIHDNGTPVDTPAFSYHVGTEFLGNSQGVLVSSAPLKATFVNCKWTAVLGPFQGSGNVDLISPTFVAPYGTAAIAWSGATGALLRVSNPTVNFTGGSSGSLLTLTSASNGSTVILEDVNLVMTSALNTIAQMPATASLLLIVQNGHITGVTGNNPLATLNVANSVALRNLIIDGTWQTAVVRANGTAGTMTGLCEVDNCDLTGFVSATGHAPFRDPVTTGTDGIFDIHDNNKVSATGSILESQGRTGHRVMSRRGKGTDVAVANPLVLGVNGDHHDVTSTADITVDNIYLKNATTPANSGTLGNAGDKRTWRHTSAHTITLTNAGNLRLAGGAASATVTQNQLVQMVGDGVGGWDIRVL